MTLIFNPKTWSILKSGLSDIPQAWQSVHGNCIECFSGTSGRGLTHLQLGTTPHPKTTGQRNDARFLKYDFHIPIWPHILCIEKKRCGTSKNQSDPCCEWRNFHSKSLLSSIFYDCMVVSTTCVYHAVPWFQKEWLYSDDVFVREITRFSSLTLELYEWNQQKKIAGNAWRLTTAPF